MLHAAPPLPPMPTGRESLTVCVCVCLCDRGHFGSRRGPNPGGERVTPEQRTAPNYTPLACSAFNRFQRNTIEVAGEKEVDAGLGQGGAGLFRDRRAG